MMYNKIDFNNQAILITGGAGFIGSSFSFFICKKTSHSQKSLYLTALEVMKFSLMAILKALDITKTL